MGINDIAKLIDGYYCLPELGDESVLYALQYSPFSGKELQGGFFSELQMEISGILMDRDEKESAKWCEMLYNMRPAFDPSFIPEDLQYMLYDKSWYNKVKAEERLDHSDGGFCFGLNAIIESCYGCKLLPKLACVPIQYCPFCGVKLPPEFDQENWWDKEFKTFKWDKDHKLGEWADDYVDDDDWTAEDYLRAYERIDAEREKMLESDKK